MVCIDDAIQTKIWLLECLLVDDHRRTMAAAATNGNYQVVTTIPNLLGLAGKNCCWDMLTTRADNKNINANFITLFCFFYDRIELKQFKFKNNNANQNILFYLGRLNGRKRELVSRLVEGCWMLKQSRILGSYVRRITGAQHLPMWFSNTLLLQ